MAAQCLNEAETRAVLLRKQDAKKRRLRPRIKSRSLPKFWYFGYLEVTEYFSAYFLLISTLARALQFPHVIKARLSVLKSRCLGNM